MEEEEEEEEEAEGESGREKASEKKVGEETSTVTSGPKTELM